jgi:hypothetical protein
MHWQSAAYFSQQVQEHSLLHVLSEPAQTTNVFQSFSLFYYYYQANYVFFSLKFGEKWPPFLAAIVGLGLQFSSTADFALAQKSWSSSNWHHTCMYIVINTLCTIALYLALSPIWKPGQQLLKFDGLFSYITFLYFLHLNMSLHNHFSFWGCLRFIHLRSWHIARLRWNLFSVITFRLSDPFYLRYHISRYLLNEKILTYSKTEI